MKPRRRTILRVLCLLLAWGAAGAAINVAVAWGITLRSENGGPSQSPSEKLQSTIWTTALGPWTQVDPTHREEGFSIVAPNEDYILYMRSAVIRTNRQTDEYEMVTQRWAGFPCLALCGAVRDYTNQASFPKTLTHQYWGAWHVVKVDPSTQISDELFLPLLPLWPGFAINTVFYAGVSWVLCCGPFALRRIIRRRRGQCAQCAYPIGWGAGQNERCTECGTPHAAVNRICG